jgi:predicted dehydrogenase
VCSPNGTHARVVLDALDAGLHVLVEKPLCLSPADAAAITDRAARSGRVVMVGYMKRFAPAYARMGELLPATGRLRLVTSTATDPAIGRTLRPAGFVAADDVPTAAAEALRRSTRAQVAAALGTDDPRHVLAFSDAFQGALVHDVNLVLGLCPGAWRVTDAAAAGDGTFAHGAWERGDGARWTATWELLPRASAFRETLAFHGAAGVARLDFPAPYLGAAPARARLETVPERSWSEPANPYAVQLEHFHACITGGAPCQAPAEQGARDVEHLTTLYRTAIAA